MSAFEWATVKEWNIPGGKRRGGIFKERHEWAARNEARLHGYTVLRRPPGGEWEVAE